MIEFSLGRNSYPPACMLERLAPGSGPQHCPPSKCQRTCHAPSTRSFTLSFLNLWRCPFPIPERLTLPGALLQTLPVSPRRKGKHLDLQWLSNALAAVDVPLPAAGCPPLIRCPDISREACTWNEAGNCGTIFTCSCLSAVQDQLAQVNGW